MFDRLLIGVRAAVFGAMFLTFWGWIALSTRRFDPAVGVAGPPAGPVLGGIVLACGAVLAFTCVALFVVRGRGTPAPFDAPRVFVATGPYRIVRNPMYVGGWLMLVGLALVDGSIAMLAFSLVWLALAHLFAVAYEEPTLHARFGGSYAEYRHRVGRWLPSIRRRP